MSVKQPIDEIELTRAFSELYPKEDISISAMFGKLAMGAAKSMHAQTEDNFDWIRKNPLGGTAYRTAVWQFLAELWERNTGQAYDFDDVDEDDLDAVGELSLTFSELTFHAYNRMAGMEDTIAEMTEQPDESGCAYIEQKVDYFRESYLEPQLRLLMAN